MKEFLFIFRMDNVAREQLSPEQLQKMSKPWEDWITHLAAKNKLSSKGHRLHPDGKMVKPGSVIMDGPYAETKEVVGGYSIITAASLGEAAEIAKGCPVFQAGGNVEVRELVIM
jgi:hypothetical protein